MKICDKCGHRNFTVKMVKKKRVCEECGDKMSDYAQCCPEIGGVERDSDGVACNHSIKKKLMHDEEPWE